MHLACASSDERSDVDATSQDRRVPLLGSVDRRLKKYKKMSVTGITTGIAWEKKKENLAGSAKGKLLGLQAGEEKQVAYRVRLTEERESQRDQVAGKRGGEMMPRHDKWRVPGSLSHR